MFGLKQEHIDLINECFAQFSGIEQIIIYGSRAKGNYKNGSDIDLTILGDLDYSSLMKLENQLDDLLLPYKIDLSLYRNISNPDLTDHIQRVGKVFYEKTPHPDSPKKSARPKHGKTNTK
ncbi:MAG: nucleotidyltransferase domain-containing protein [Saprospiraceae bacterium]|jgi:predicted nucleotidyltransferase|nr:nucleotidyltransferase domain-containing protein [Saprospiraceae bacterium]HRD81760.1 nucleotidyltransferase domain-containing protein [Saprospiraceae bacterium]